jgi:hypothetical protein
MSGLDSQSLGSDAYVRMHDFVRWSACVPFRQFMVDVRREFMKRLSAALHGNLSFYLQDA